MRSNSKTNAGTGSMRNKRLAFGAISAGVALTVALFAPTAAVASTASAKTIAKTVAAEQENEVKDMRGYVCDPNNMPKAGVHPSGLVEVKPSSQKLDCPRNGAGFAAYTAQVTEVSTGKVLEKISQKFVVGKKEYPAATPAPQPVETSTPAPTPTVTPTPTETVTPQPVETATPTPTAAAPVASDCNGSSTDPACITVLTYNCKTNDTISLDVYGLNGRIVETAKGMTTVISPNKDGKASVRITMTASRYTGKNNLDGVDRTFRIIGSYSALRADDNKAPTAVKPLQPAGSPTCLRSVDQWGTKSGVTDLSYAFAGQRNLARVAEPPATVTNMTGMFQNSGFNQNISNWNVQNVNSFADFRTGAALTTENTPYKFR